MTELVTCAKRSLRLTEAGCARLYLSTVESPPSVWEARSACAFCPVGAARAGVTRSIQAAEAVDAWRRCCSRCQAGGRRLVGGQICVSCYNRDREARIGCDRKGHRPLFTDDFHSATVVVVRDGKAKPETFDRVTSAAEALISAARAATGPLRFGWQPRGQAGAPA